MGKFDNKKKDDYLKSIPTCGLDNSDIAARSKFNLSFFDDSQSAGQSFSVWGATIGITSLENLLEKVKAYTKEPLSYWKNQRTGAGGLKVLEVYRKFPKSSSFTHPAHVPHDVEWARFRLGNKVRLIGFVIPKSFSSKEYKHTDKEIYPYDSNTFYVVFLDKDHNFYKTEND